jgi:hypothetical protein
MTQLDIFTAERAPPSFSEDAMGFLLAYVRRSKGCPFCAEEVTLAALDAGLAPVSLRSWGRVFVLAKKAGHIRRSDVCFRRSMGNGTLVPGWVST